MKNLSNDIPADIIFEIFRYLIRYDDLYNCSLVCKKFSLIFKNELLWKEQLEVVKKFGFYRKEMIKDTYLETYKTHYCMIKLVQCLKYGTLKYCDIDDIYNLEELNFNGNNSNYRRTKIVLSPKKWIYMSQIKNLKYIHVGFMNISCISDRICYLNNLERLYAQDNKITDFSVLTNLKNLVKLKLSNNAISHIPDDIDKLTNLKYLWLDNNKITKICNNVLLMPNLKCLNLIKNQIKYIPGNINAETIKIRKILLSGNLVTYIPAEYASIKYKFDIKCNPS